jgi:hypothetical protein
MEGLGLQTDAAAILAEFAGTQIGLETAEGDAMEVGRGGKHFSGQIYESVTNPGRQGQWSACLGWATNRLRIS